eukprot:tig00021468_g21646.t1
MTTCAPEDSVAVLHLSIERRDDTLDAIKAMEARGVAVPSASGGRHMLSFVREGGIPQSTLDFFRLASYTGPPERAPASGFISVENERLALRDLRQHLLGLLEHSPGSEEADRAELERLRLASKELAPEDPAAVKLRRRELVVRARMQENRIRTSIVKARRLSPSEELWQQMMAGKS